MRLALALIGASIAISFSDWLFFGVLFHDRYMQTPALWREMPESRKIAGSMALAVVGTAAFLFLAQTLGVRGFGVAFELAFLVWLAASLPQTVTNTLYIKYSRAFGVSHALGWLARLLIAAGAYAFMVR
jgi:polyferredoxin